MTADSPTPSPAPDAIKALRKRHKLTQTDAARILGLTLNGFQRFEQGERTMRPLYWTALCNHVGEGANGSHGVDRTPEARSKANSVDSAPKESGTQSGRRTSSRPMPQAQYMAFGATQCPFCRATDDQVRVCNAETRDWLFARQYVCGHCGGSWEEIYQYRRFRVTGRPTRTNQEKSESADTSSSSTTYEGTLLARHDRRD
jgi:DNA-binding XRE family transcriptional regulator